MTTYKVDGPFERIFQDDFHNDLKTISVSLGALKRCPMFDNQFEIDIEQVKKDLWRMSHDPEAVYETDYFAILVDDLQELFAFDVTTRFTL
ncbi:hypothetical protein [Halalkalibacter sp. APA_J-10(15)]|uniref:hypothetical protein n=1 Tax=Halalkalibacter sp. APA_J-10(15) TaxID=2933805 RepID=UPI001FF3C43E|nr:hypothetical protein [Halalkalibacter sp. APA_J-10(15)]